MVSPAWPASTPDAGALLDYAERGEAAGLAPGPHFDPTWYAAVYGLDPGVSPLAHFLRHRSTAGFAPSPRLWGVAQRPARRTRRSVPGLAGCARPIRSARRRQISRLLAAAGLFDANHYQIVNNDVFESDLDPLAHYCAFGWRKTATRASISTRSWYLATNPEVIQLGVNPLLHYLLAGEAAERRPVVYFEPGWYRRTYGVPPGQSALAHYLAHRHTGTFSPNAMFDPVLVPGALRSKPASAPRSLCALPGGGHARRPSPSAQFDAAAWRTRRRGRRSRHFTRTLTPERDNPLIDFLLLHYR